MGLISSLRFIVGHPLSRGRKLSNVWRFFAWQVGARLIPGPVVTDFVGCATLLARPGMTGVTGNIYVGLHEFEEMSFVLHALRPDDLFVDVGANVGAYTVLASAVVGARSIAFEPAEDTFRWLSRNIAVNGIGDFVRARREAVGAECGSVSFTQQLDSVNHVATAQSERGMLVAAVTASVRMVTLDEALGEETPAVVKIDVEGFETEVVRGGKRVLAEPGLLAIVMELNGSGARYGYDEAALRTRLREFGFSEFTYAPLERRLTPVLAAADLPPGNVILVRDADAMRARLESAPRRDVRGHAL